jgi:hypothetical protein
VQHVQGILIVVRRLSFGVEETIFESAQKFIGINAAAAISGFLASVLAEVAWDHVHPWRARSVTEPTPARMNCLKQSP